MAYDPQDFQDHFALFELENHSPDWPLYKSPEAITLLRNKAASLGGRISISHFIIAFNQLRDTGTIKQLRHPTLAETEESGDLTVEAYRSLPSAVVQRRYQNDPDFRSQVDDLISKGLI